MKYSLKRAAEATGKSKPTILRALQSGKISGQKNEQGEWRIDPAELHRAFTLVQCTGTDKHHLETHETEMLRRELAILRQERQRDHHAIEDLKQDRDHWRQQATALLTDQRQKGGFWAQFFNRSR